MRDVIKNNRNTKVKLIYRCNVESIKASEVKKYAFHSNIEVNLDGTDEKDLYDTIVDRILENIATFIF